MKALVPFGLAALVVFPAPLLAENGFHEIEGEVTIARRDSAEIQHAERDWPVEAGDRLTTGATGRAEVVLRDGSRLWLDQETRIDVTSLGTSPVLRLWRGSLALALRRDGEVRFDTPAGSVYALEKGLYWLSAEPNGRVAVRVEAGLAEAAGRASSVLLRAGQGTRIRPGDDPEDADRYHTVSNAAFAGYVGRYMEEPANADSQVREDDLPAPIQPYARDLAAHGSWRWYAPVETYVWFPAVGRDWRPFRSGRWIHQRDRLTWISSDPWGSATYHYGAWDYGDGFGWFWIPGDEYSPAWVDWYDRGNYVAWCPRGNYRYHDHRGRERERHRREHRKDRPFDPDRSVVVTRDRLVGRSIGDVVKVDPEGFAERPQTRHDSAPRAKAPERAERQTPAADRVRADVERRDSVYRRARPVDPDEPERRAERRFIFPRSQRQESAPAEAAPPPARSESHSESVPRVLRRHAEGTRPQERGNDEPRAPRRAEREAQRPAPPAPPPQKPSATSDTSRDSEGRAKRSRPAREAEPAGKKER